MMTGKPVEIRQAIVRFKLLSSGEAVVSETGTEPLRHVLCLFFDGPFISE